MLLSEEETTIKAQLWYSENGDYLKEQEGELNISLFTTVYMCVHTVYTLVFVTLET